MVFTMVLRQLLSHNYLSPNMAAELSLLSSADLNMLLQLEVAEMYLVTGCMLVACL